MGKIMRIKESIPYTNDRVANILWNTYPSGVSIDPNLYSDVAGRLSLSTMGTSREIIIISVE